MPAIFSEERVHEHMLKVGLEDIVLPCPVLESEIASARSGADDEFSLWRLVKRRALEKIERIHDLMADASFLASKLKLPIDQTRPMELDLIGQHNDGIFILELKVGRAAERNAFTELYGYSHYVAEMFGLSGSRDITNVLVAPLDAKITRQAFLYDLLVSDREIIVYQPKFFDDRLESLKLDLHIPSDEDFRSFTNDLLSHEAMSCLVVSFDDVPGWFDSNEIGSRPNPATQKHLDKMASYTAQLMEAEGLHGFCFVRKRWAELPFPKNSSLFICAVNPFVSARDDRVQCIANQMDWDSLQNFLEAPRIGFVGRLERIASQVMAESLTRELRHEFEYPSWNQIVCEMTELYIAHVWGFRPTGIMREAYVAYIDSLYQTDEDVSRVQVNEIMNWSRAWTFMEMCGLKNSQTE